MIAHAKTDIDNNQLYSPNIFIRLGLLLLTIIIVAFSFGLISLLAISSSETETTFSILCIFFAILSYVGAEAIVKTKKHYESGVDDALIWMTFIFLLTAVNIFGTTSGLTNSLIVFATSLFFAIRFRAPVMSLISGLSLLAIVFFFLLQALGDTAKLIMPFAIMLVSATSYFIVTAIRHNNTVRYHKSCLLITRILFLVTLFIGGNYFVVRESANEFFDAGFLPGQPMAFGWLFWIMTYALPLVYILAGIVRKDRVLLRVGLVLIVALVLTVRYYFHIIPAEVALVIGGIASILFCSFLMRYLKQPKHGFTYQNHEEDKEDSLNVEALIIAGTFTAPQIAPAATQFGGGSGGGGGATGDF